VRDAVTGVPIGGASVIAGSSQFTTLENGSFIMEVPSGTYTVTATATGFQTKNLADITISSGTVFDANVSLKVYIPPGDINADGKVDLADAIIALQVLSNITKVEQFSAEGDVNSDGKIGLQEAIYIMQKAAGVR